MASFASVFILNIEDLPKLRALSSALPKSDVREISSVSAQRHDDSAKDQSPFTAFWHYIDDHSREPFPYDWDGFCMETCLRFLQDQGIDLTNFRFEMENYSFAFILLDKKVKSKYFKKLSPSNFPQERIDEWFIETGSTVPPESVIDGIELIHQYLDLVDDSNVALLHTDFLQSLFQSKASKKGKSSKKTKNSFYLNLIRYVCETCGERLAKAPLGHKRIGDPPDNEQNICGTEIMEGNIFVDKTQKTYRSNTEGMCSALATRRYLLTIR